MKYNIKIESETITLNPKHTFTVTLEDYPLEWCDSQRFIGGLNSTNYFEITPTPERGEVGDYLETTNRAQLIIHRKVYDIIEEKLPLSLKRCINIKMPGAHQENEDNPNVAESVFIVNNKFLSDVGITIDGIKDILHDKIAAWALLRTAMSKTEMSN